MKEFMDAGLIQAELTITHNGTANTVTSSNIVDGSFSLNRYSTSAVSFEFGNVSAGELKFSINNDTLTPFTIERGDIVTGRLYVDENSQSIGEFIVTDVDTIRKTVNVTCLDKMILLDGKINLSSITFPMTAQAFLQSVYVPLGFSIDVQSNIDTSITLTDPAFEVGTTYRQALSALCECLGAGAYMDGTTIKIRWNDNATQAETIDESSYVELLLTEKSYRVQIEVTTDIYKSACEVKDGVIYLRIVANPFIANFTASQRTQYQTALNRRVNNKAFYGGSITTLPMPTLYPYDSFMVIKDGQQHLFAVSSITYGINENTKLESKVSSDDNGYNFGVQRDIRQLKTDMTAVKHNEKHFFYRDDSGIHITMVENDWTTGRNMQIDSNNLEVRDGTTVVASFGTTNRVGKANGRNVTIGSSSVDINNGSTNYASFGSTTRIGQASTSHITMSSSNMLMYDNENKEAVRIQSGGNILMPMSENFTVLSGRATASSFNYTTPVLGHTIDWTNGVTILLTANYGVGVVAESSITELSLASASSTATATIRDSTSQTVCKVTASCVSGTKIKLAFTNITEDGSLGFNLWDVSMVVGYRYQGEFNYMRIKGNVPQISFYNDLGTATSYIRAYNGGEYGNNLVFQSGGNVFIGGGEYANNRYAYDLGESTSENSYFGADGTVYIESGANTISDRNTWAFNTNGTLTFPKGAVFNTSAGIRGVNFGDGYDTEATYIWGNTNNVVGIGCKVYNYARFNLTARIDSLNLFQDGETVWKITGLRGEVDASNPSFKAFETFTFSAGTYSGYVSSTSTELNFFVPLPKKANGRTATIPKTAMVIRGINGYVDDSYNTTTVGTTSAYTWTVTALTNGLRIVVKKSSAYTNATNNTPVSVTFRSSPTVTFS